MFLTGPVLLDLSIALMAYILYFFPKWKQYSKRDFLIRNIFYFYMVIVIGLTLMPIAASIPGIFNRYYLPMNMWAFRDVLLGNGPYYVQIFLNVLLMIPFGFFLAYIKEYSLIKVVTYTFIFTLLIELIQPLLLASRISDITDIITNSLGGLIGYLVYYLYLKFRSKDEI